jgi:two-component system, LytTR family, response regulator
MTGVRLRALVADDELQARKRVTRLLEQLPTVEVVASCASCAEVLAELRRTQVDVLILDISMPGQSGLELSAQLGSRGPAVIFVTAHAHHAASAFDLGVVDYVLKPVTAARLATAIDRVIARAPAPAACAGPAATAAAAPRLALETRSGVVLVDPTAIVYARFDGALVTVATALTSWVTDLSLTELAERLPAGFWRVDRRHLLNLDEVATLRDEPSGGYLAVTRSGAEVPVSRAAARELRRRLGL